MDQKARCVVRGSAQLVEKDFYPYSVYTTVPGFKTMRIFLGISAHDRLRTRQIDAKSIYLRNPLSEVIYLPWTGE